MKKVIQSIFERKSKYSETGSSSERNAPREEAVETGVDAYRDRSAIERDTGSNTLAGDLAMSVSLSPRPRPVNPLRPRINRDRSITVGESSRPHFYVNNHSSIEVDTTRGDCTRSVSEHVRPQGSHRDDSGVGDRSNTRRHSPLKVSEHRNSHDNNNDDSGSRPATGVRPQKSVYINGSVFQMYDPSSHCSTPPPVMYSPMPRTGGYESSEEDRRESSSFHAPVHQTRVSSTFGISSNASPTHPRIPSLNEFGGCNDHEYEDDVEGGQSGPESEGVAQGGRRFPTLRTALAVRKRNSNINEFSALSEFIPPPREKPNDPHWIKGESGRWFLQSCDPRKPPRHQSNRDSVVSGSILDADDCPKKLSRYNYDKQQYFDDHMQEVQGNLDPDKAKQELEQQAHRFAIMMRRTRRMASIGARAGDKFLITFERLQPHNSSEQEQECVTNQGDNYNYREASDTAVEDSDEREGALGKPRNQGGGVCRKPPLQPLLPPPGPLLQSVVFSSTHKSRSLQDIQARGLSSPAPRQQTRIPSSSPEPLPHGAASQPPRERNSMPARPSRNPSTSTPKRQSYGTSSSKGTAHRVYYEHDTEIKPTSRSSYLRNKSSTTTSITRMGARGIVVRGSSSEHQRELGSEYVEPTPPNALVIRPDRSGNGVVFLEGSSFGRERSTHATSTMTYVKGQEEIEKCTTDTNFIAAKRTTRSTLDGDAKLTSNPHTGSSKDRTDLGRSAVVQVQYSSAWSSAATDTRSQNDIQFEMEDNNIAYQQSDTLDNVSTTITVTNIGILNGTGESELHPQDSSSKSRVRLSTPRRLLQGIRKARQLFSPKQEQSTAVLGAESVLVAENEELEFGQHSEDIGCDDDDDDQQQQQQLSLFDPMQNIKEPWCEGSCREGQGTEERNRTHPLYTRGGNRPVLIQPAQIRSLFLVMDEIPWSADVERPESDTRQKATTEGGQVRETLELEQTPQEPTLLSITALHRSKSLPSTHFCSKTSILVSSGSDDTNSIQGPAIETFTFTIPAITTVAHALEPTPRPAPVLFDGMTPEELIQSIRFENDREGSHVFYGTREYERDQERKRRLARVGEKKTGQQGQEGLLKRTSKRAGEVMAKAKSLTSLPARILFGANAGMSDGNGSGSGSDGSGGSGQTTGRTGDGPSSMEASSVSDVILETVSGMASTMWTRATTTLMGRISAPSVNREGKGENGKERKGEEEEEEKDLFLPDKDAKAAGMSTAESNCP